MADDGRVLVGSGLPESRSQAYPPTKDTKESGNGSLMAKKSISMTGKNPGSLQNLQAGHITQLVT